MPMYSGSGTHNGGLWNNNNGHDEVAALLGELGQAQSMGGMGMEVGGMGGGGGGNALFDMLADWVATGYDGGAIGLNTLV